MILDELDRDTRRCSSATASTRETFERLRARVADGSLTPATNVVTGRLEPLADEDLTPLPEPGSTGWDEARSAGLEALRRGEVAQVILNGGMATRFGGVVKGVVQVLDGRSFLELKLDETAGWRASSASTVPAR